MKRVTGVMDVHVSGRMLWIRVCLLMWIPVWTLSPACSQADTLKGYLLQQETLAKAWLEDLYQHGVEIRGDSTYFNEETRRIAADSLYRQLIYPEVYSWETVSAFLHRKWLKPAFWYLINLYHADTSRQDLVLRMILPLDQTLEMDRALLAAFYTYIPFDPQVYTLVNGKTVEVRRPDIAEYKLRAVKAMVDQILAQRRMKENQHQKE